MSDREQFGVFPDRISSTKVKRKKVIVCVPCPDPTGKQKTIPCPAKPCPDHTGEQKTTPRPAKPWPDHTGEQKTAPRPGKPCPYHTDEQETAPRPAKPCPDPTGEQKTAPRPAKPCPTQSPCPGKPVPPCPEAQGLCSPCPEPPDPIKLAQNLGVPRFKRPPKQMDYVYRCESRELLGSKLLKYCLCVRRNGLQDECPRTPCRGRPACLEKPWPDCWPSGGCHGIDYDRQQGFRRVNPTLQYRMDNKKCGPVGETKIGYGGSH